MDAAPDFEALRARRNAAVQEMHQKMADEWGVPLQSLRSNFNPAACYCACGTGGPCEHKWDGEGWESEDGCAWSATCSRCMSNNKPLRRGVDGVCARSTCECEREGLGDQCVWLRPVEAEFECLGEPSLCTNPRGCACVPDSKTPNARAEPPP